MMFRLMLSRSLCGTPGSIFITAAPSCGLNISAQFFKSGCNPGGGFRMLEQLSLTDKKIQIKMSDLKCSVDV